MKTNVVLQSCDRNLFGVIIRQNTKDGQMLSVSDLTRAYESARFQYGWGQKNLTTMMQSKDFIERCFYVLQELDLIKLHINSFIEMVQKEGIVKVLKGLGVWATKGRGENKSTYSNPYIWVMIALEMNPKIYAKVVLWLTDSLIVNRITAGAEFLPLTSSIKTIIKEPKYSEYFKAINSKVFGRHEKGIRDTASSDELRIISDIEKFLTQSIGMGMIQNENHLLKAISLYK